MSTVTQTAGTTTGGPRSLAELPTPCAVVDVPRMRANLDRMAAYTLAHGLGLRPHVKTHKSAVLAREQLERGALGVTVATGREAVVMSDVATDILLAYPTVSHSRLAVVGALPAATRLSVALDSTEAVDALAGAAARASRTVGVLVEVDVGMQRCGVQTVDAALAVARRTAEHDALAFRGVMFYPGHIREHVDAQDAALERLNAELGRFLDGLRDAGVTVEVVSGGSTPTAWNAHRVPAQTEVRPGTYIFNDRTTAVIGACDWDECAYSVLATVVSTGVAGQAVIDAGSKALAREELRGPASQTIDLGHGRATPASGLAALLDRPEISVRATSEEHGILDLSQAGWRPRVGERVRVVPNHVCVSVNLQEVVWGVDGDDVVARWDVTARGWTVGGGVQARG
ncbi:MAG: alanine racemase [Longimicrobiales bacterium]